MKIAVISDIHSNPFALKAVLKDIEARWIDTIICTGDLVGYLPLPNEVIDLIRERKILTLQGNHDDYVARIDKISREAFEKKSLLEIQGAASALYTRYILTEENRDYIANLPERVEMRLGGKDFLFVHGSPRAIAEYMYEDTKNLEEILASVHHHVIISGHTHLPYHIKVGDKDILNAGSVGKPKLENGASTYLIIESHQGPLKSEVVELFYDTKPMVEAILDNPYISNDLISVIKPNKG